MENFSTPTLLLNEQIARTNIRRMADKARSRDLRFKPHMKTHQSAAIGKWFREAGAKAITVSSVDMARYFGRHGWDDITIAFPCNIRQLPDINELAQHISLTLLVNSMATARALDDRLSQEVQVYIEIDTGAGRTGLRTTDLPGIRQLIEYFENSSLLHWKGFYSHPGHSYRARSQSEIREIHQTVQTKITNLRNHLAPDYTSLEVCIGDTPCCSVAQNFDGIDAISPGNFVFYDLMQAQIGSCEIKDIATAVVCPVVDTFPHRNELAIYGGAIHFSKEALETEAGRHFGWVASHSPNGWQRTDPPACLKSISQEHGIIHGPAEMIAQYSVGDTLTILPVHSCLTAHLLGTFQLVGSGRQIRQFS